MKGEGQQAFIWRINSQINPGSPRSRKTTPTFFRPGFLGVLLLLRSLVICGGHDKSYFLNRLLLSALLQAGGATRQRLFCLFANESSSQELTNTWCQPLSAKMEKLRQTDTKPVKTSI